MKKNNITIALVQQTFSNDVEDNHARLKLAVEQAAEQAELIVLPELHNSLYFCQHKDKKYFSLAEEIPGPTVSFLATLAKAHNVVIVGSVFEVTENKQYFNTAIVLEKDGSLAGRYRKIHIPDDPGYYEQYYFASGDQGFSPINTSVGALGVMVCFDQWFPEAARSMMLAGADILLYPTAIGYDPADDSRQQASDRDAWTTVQRGHAIANIIPVAACNRVGFEATPDKALSNGINFWGSSFICGQQGEIFAQASENEDEIITAKLDLTRTEKLHKIWTFNRDRKPDQYKL